MKQSYETRMEMIRKASAKFNATLKRSHDARKSETPKEERGIDTHNINAYTDAEKYVNEYYGDRAREQNSYESEWN